MLPNPTSRLNTRYQVTADLAGSFESMGGVGGHAALEINDIPIVRYWAQAPDGKSTKHRIAAALDLVCEPVGTRSNAKRGMGGGALGGSGSAGRGMGISKECHRSRTPASAASASHDLWDCREGTCSPANATSPCGRPVLASHDRRTSHDGILRQAAKLGFVQCKVFHVHVRSYSLAIPPRRVLPNARDVTLDPLAGFGFYFASLFVKGFSSLGTRCCCIQLGGQRAVFL